MAPFQDWGTPGDAPGGGIAGPYDEMSRVLATLPRPRPVRMSRRGKIIAMVVSIALLASLGIYAAAGVAAQQAAGGQNTGPPQFPVYALSIAFIVVIWHRDAECDRKAEALACRGRNGHGACHQTMDGAQRPQYLL